MLPTSILSSFAGPAPSPSLPEKGKVLVPPVAPAVANEGQPPPLAPVDVQHLIFWVQFVVVTGVLVTLLYHFYKLTVSYVGSRSFSVHPTFRLGTEHSLRAGNTVCIKLTFYKTPENGSNGEERACNSTDVSLINTYLNLRVERSSYDGTGSSWFGLWRSTSPLELGINKTFTKTKDEMILRFSLRKSGVYHLHLFYGCYFTLRNSPILFEVHPATISVSKTHIEAPDSSCDLIPTIVDQWTLLKLRVMDRYNNTIDLRDPNDPFIQGLKVTTRNAREADVLETEFDLLEDKDPSELCLKVKTSRFGVTKCILAQNLQVINYFTLITLSEEEDQEVKRMHTSSFTGSPTAVKSLLLSHGDEQVPVPNVVWLSVNQNHVTISNTFLGVISTPFLTFAVNRRTKVEIMGEGEDTKLRISDDVQPSILLGVGSSTARIFLAKFGHFKHNISKRVTYGDKTSTLKKELGAGFLAFLSRSGYSLRLDPQDLFISSMKQQPKDHQDWVKPFIIGVIKDGCPTPPGFMERTLFGVRGAPTPVPQPAGIGTAPMGFSSLFHQFGSTSPPTRPMEYMNWMNMIISKLFGIGDSNNCNPGGLFSPLPGSIRLHPTMPSKRETRYGLEEMEFAGAILGKCVTDSLVRGVCLDLTRIRLTKSFMAMMLGIPLTYEFLETDYPTLYEEHVKPLLSFYENGGDISTKKLFFTTPTSSFIHDFQDSTGGPFNLLPDGNNTAVGNSNFKYYLNLLSHHVLKLRVEQEIQAFRLGLFKVLPQGILAEFEIDEFEKLLCGGGSSFSFTELKNNHRVLGELPAVSGSSTDLTTSRTNLLTSSLSAADRRRMTSWFWTTLKNFHPYEEDRLITLVTGLSSLPSCGFRKLNPRFTISLTGGQNQPPTFHPSMHLVAIGKHDNFTSFEQAFLKSIWSDGKDEIGEGLKVFGSETDFAFGQDEMDLPTGPWPNQVLMQVISNCAVM